MTHANHSIEYCVCGNVLMQCRCADQNKPRVTRSGPCTCKTPHVPTRATTDGNPPAPGHEHVGAPQPIEESTGQHKAYWVLSEEERSKGFVRPVRRSYQHEKCRTVTRMGLAIAETYARDPSFYGSTFCVACGVHLPVAQFCWLDERTGEVTTDRLGS